MVEFRNPFFKSNQNVEGSFKGNKNNYDENYVEMEKNFDALKKSATLLQNNIDKFVEPRKRLRTKLLSANRKFNDPKEMKDHTCEKILSDSCEKATPVLTSLTKSYFTLFQDFFQDLNKCKVQFIEFYTDNIRPDYKHLYELPAEEIKTLGKKVESKRCEAVNSKNDKKSTPEIIEATQQAFDEIKAHRENLMLDYNENTHIDRIAMWLKLFESIKVYHESCFKAASSYTESLKSLQLEAKSRGNIPHVPMKRSDAPELTKLSNKYSDYNSNRNSEPKNISFEEYQELDAVSAEKVSRAPEPPQLDTSYSMVARNTKTYATGLFDFDAESNDELTIKAGDVIEIIERVDENWFNAELNGVRGFVPCTYVKIMK